jgi:protoporphyrinogen oxidase
MKRFYGLPADKIDIKFAASRMLWVKNQAILRNHLHRLFKPSEHVITNTQLVRPREGFAHLYEGAVRRLERSGVRFELGARMQELTKSDGMFTLRTERADFRSKRVVSTIPLARIQSLCGIHSEETLSTVTLISLFYSFQGNRGFHDSILYNFSHDGCWKRLTVYSDFYGLCGGREFFAVEVNADHVQGSVEIAQQDFRRHVIANRLFVGDLKFEGSHTLSDAYPVYAEGADERAAKMIAVLGDLGVESFGRQGGFEYQPTARHTTLEAEAALSRK